ncbi:SDR family oxidoreductase [Nonomuraea sp. NBC_01738]|uniref:SDR family oxidoreductase n=1 Tax=Nonomuraea sp. NBC_01738 TaxID=2976003 RepID=UPI002E13E654|nr:SDR family oxidoreductase [Nonomuraea sp. NBC_01738]
MRLIQSQEVRLALFEEGDPGNPTILLVHGYPDTHRVWDEVAALLRDRFHVVSYDVRGAGASTAPRDRRHYAFDHLAADLAAVLDAIGKPRVHLVGHDWGSLQSWEAIARPGIAPRIASFTSFGGPGLDQAAHFMRYGKRREIAGQLLRSWYIGAFQLPFLPELAWRKLVPGALERSMRLAEGIEPRPGHPADTLVADGRNGLGLYRRNFLNRLRTPGDPMVDVPVQLIETTKDIFVSPKLLASIASWVPEFWHRKLAAGHWAQRSHPEIVARMIAEFAGHLEGGASTRSLRRDRAGEGRKAFENRLVVVTGAGSGIGRATARAFAAHGAEVVVADLDEAAATQVAEAITKDFGRAAHPVLVDVSDAAQMDDFARNIALNHGVPDVVVNNAGIAVTGPILEHSLDDWKRTLDVNLWGVIHGCRLFAQQMIERGEGGHIVNIASLAAFAPSRILPAYSVSKAAVKSLSDCLRAELAGQGIGVTAICPGFVTTGIARNATFVGPDLRELAERGLERRGYPPERVAAHVLRAVHRNDAVVPVNAEGRLGYLMSRLSPGAMRAFARISGGLRNPPVGR